MSNVIFYARYILKTNHSALQSVFKIANDSIEYLEYQQTGREGISSTLGLQTSTKVACND